MKIFAINPGSTSTKIALFEDDQMVFSRNVSHDAEELKKFKEIRDQFPYRKETILKELADAGQTLENTDAFVGRGGGLVNIVGGTYTVTTSCWSTHAPASRSSIRLLWEHSWHMILPGHMADRPL